MEEKIKSILDIISNVMLYTRCYTIIRTADGDPTGKKGKAIKQSDFLRFSETQNLSDALLELSKLFPQPNKYDIINYENNQHSFRTLIEEIRKAGLVTEQKLAPIIDYIKQIETEPVDGTKGIEGQPDFKPRLSITEIIKLWRNKVIAHTDSDREKFYEEMGVSAMNLNQLIRHAIGILKMINEELPVKTEMVFDERENITTNLSEVITKLSTFVNI